MCENAPANRLLRTGCANHAVVKRYITLLLRYRASILAFAAILSVLATYQTVKLYGTLRPSLEELLPANARSVVDLNEVRRRLKSLDSLAVLILSSDAEAGRRFVDDLVRELRTDRSGRIGKIEYRIEEELAFFRSRRALYIDLPDLRRLRDYVERRIDYEKEIRNPLNIFAEIDIPEPRFNFEKLRSKYEERAGSYARFPRGYFASPDERRRVLLIYPSIQSTDGTETGERVEDLLKFRKIVDQAVEELNPSSYAADLEVRYSGNVQNLIEEQTAILDDLLDSLVLVAVLVLASILYYFKSVRATVALILSLAAGAVWSFAVAYAVVGSLNANSAFMGSIIIGNGINFGIILTARFLENRKRGEACPNSVEDAAQSTASATWTAALAAALSYGSLTLTGFRGFRQFGIIGLIGMILCWVSAFTVLPAILSICYPRIEKRFPQTESFFFRAVTWLIQKHARAIIALSVMTTLVALFALRLWSPDIFETDLRKVRSRESLERGSLYYSRYVDEIFGRYLSPVVILAKESKEANEIARRLREKSEQKNSLIASVQTLSDFVPSGQRQKIKILREIDHLVSAPAIRRRMSARDRKQIDEFLTSEAFRPVAEAHLPHLILDRFTEKEGARGRMVLVEPPLGERMRKRENLFGFVNEVRGIADSVRPGTAVAGTLPVTADMFYSVANDGPRATLFAFLAVLILVFALFRSLKTGGAVLSTLFLGVLWLVGILLSFDIKINFLNFIALPITFGIGVDYGVNLFQRYREEGSGAILKAVRNTGSAVALCSLTTIIGYGSLLFAKNLGFYSFGLVATLGEITCIVAALVTIPAAILVRDRAKRREEAPAPAERAA